MTKLEPVFSNISALGADASDEFAATASSMQFNLMTDMFSAAGVGSTQYYNYQGSLTTPGCNEGINWFLMANPMYLSPRQVLAFTSVLATEQGGMSRGADNRLIQPLNGRTVTASWTPSTPAVVISSTLKLAGLTKATFTTALQTTFKTAVASSVGVPLTAVTIVSMTDTTTRRSLLTAGVDVAYTITVPTAAAASAVRTALTVNTASTSSPLMTSLTAIPGVTGVTVTAAATTGAAAGPATSAAPRAATAAAAVIAAAVALII
jgi:hypothetical protein